ncbi:GSK3-beta interaction protein [Dermacentor silvarum]|uniref:GSK3-beta interaction protein n=1 Tax=Dermacentor silvarum TaxID=543639 RepID=UPI00189B2610|nr:GSK3-beta interaction protein [Dermacentor silvarum]XP_049521282.1 GSK3-beta interaction protein [Dermacentor silvarum]
MTTAAASTSELPSTSSKLDKSDKATTTPKPAKSSMETVSPSSKVFHYGIEEVPFQQELKSIIEEIRFGVTDVGMSTLPSDELASYFNLQTKEDKRICIMMSRQGFQVVGNDYNLRDIEDGQCFETVDALLDSLSPTYRRLFNEALTKRLQDLQKDDQSIDEMSTGSTDK